jgi:xylulokinase
VTTSETVLGIDIGTSSTKGILARPDGTVVKRGQRTHKLSFPQPGRAEHDAERIWWDDVRSLCAELLPAATGLRGISVSGIGPCLLPCDRSVRPLRPAILYGIDTRATAEICALEERYGADAILARSGSALSSQAVGPKLLWLRRNEPDVWSRTAGWYMASSFIVARLTGEYVLDHHSASQCDPIYDLDASGWADDWADEIAPGVTLPRLVWPADVVGTVTAEAAAGTGLPAGVPVVAGTIDAWVEAFSAGVRRPGDLMLMYGSTMFFVQVVEAPLRDRMLWCTQGVEAGTRTVAAGMSTSGALLEWLRELLGGPPWDELTAAAARVPAGSLGLIVLPYFAGERTPVYDPNARGVVIGLTLGHGRAELVRAAYEGIAYGARQILELIARTGLRPRRLVAVGGGTRASLWTQIVSDVLGVEQELPEQTVGACYGDALLAAIGVGLVPSDTDWSQTATTVRPGPDPRFIYDALFDLYCRLYPATVDVAHGIASLQG